MTHKLALILVATSVVTFGACKKKDTAEPSPAAETKSTNQAKPAEEAKPAGPVGVAQLSGTWTKSDAPDIQWTFNTDGTSNTKTSVTEFAGTFELKDNHLTKLTKQMPNKDYEDGEVTANKLRLKDTKFGDIIEFKK